MFLWTLERPKKNRRKKLNGYKRRWMVWEYLARNRKAYMLKCSFGP